MSKMRRDLLLSANDGFDVLKFAIRSSLNGLSLFNSAPEPKKGDFF
jgi:hypothetical protein